MTKETKKAMDDAFDIIADLMEHINDINQERRYINGKDHPNSRDILNRARGVKDDINDELYKTL